MLPFQETISFRSVNVIAGVWTCESNQIYLSSVHFVLAQVLHLKMNLLRLYLKSRNDTPIQRLLNQRVALYTSPPSAFGAFHEVLIFSDAQLGLLLIHKLAPVLIRYS